MSSLAAAHSALPVQPSATDKPRILVLQDGARHNYAVPAVFEEASMLEALYTDLCAEQGIGRLATLAAHVPLPGLLRKPVARLAGRKMPSSLLEKTKTFERPALLYEIARLFATTPLAKRQARVNWKIAQADAMLRAGFGNATHLYTTLGDGGAFRNAAREAGLMVCSDVIIALSTARIVQEEYERFPDWGPPPVSRAKLDKSDIPPRDALLTRTDRFICPSEFVRDDLVKTWGVDPARTRLVPYAVADNWFAIEPDPQPGRILFAGTVERRKGIHYLAMAADRLRQRGKTYEFRIAGGVCDEIRQQSACKPLTFLDRVPRNKVASEFAQADMLVLPSLAEGSATVTYEAMAAGLPVVTTPGSGSAVRDGLDGLIVPERHPEALADAIEALVEDRERRNRMARSARQHAQLFTWAGYGPRLVDAVTGRDYAEDICK